MIRTAFSLKMPFFFVSVPHAMVPKNAVVSDSTRHIPKCWQVFGQAAAKFWQDRVSSSPLMLQCWNKVSGMPYRWGGVRVLGKNFRDETT